MSVFAAGIDAFTQATMRVVVVQRLVVAAVAIAEKLATGVPTQVLGLFEGIGDAGNTTFRVVLILWMARQQLLSAEGGVRLQHPRTRAMPWFGGDRCLKNRLCCVKKLLIAARGDLLEFSRYSNFGHEGLVSVNILSISLAYCLG
ncbi:hypothetical protein D3C75_998580 [compost metagenome]